MSENGILIRSLRTIWHGFLLGVGFSIALGIASVVIGALIQHQVREITNTVSDSPSEAQEDKIKDLQLIDVEEKKEGTRDYIIGAVKNNGSKQMSAISIQVDMFKAGKFVDQYSTYVSKLGPSSSQYFKIECGCSNGTPADHDSYKVNIKSGY